MHDSWTCPIPSPTLVLSSTLRACCSPLCLLAQLKSRPVSSYISPNGGCSWLGKRERFLQLTWFFNFFLLFFSCNEIISYLNKKKKKKSDVLNLTQRLSPVNKSQITLDSFLFPSFLSFSLFFFLSFHFNGESKQGSIANVLMKKWQTIHLQRKQTNQ